MLAGTLTSPLGIRPHVAAIVATLTLAASLCRAAPPASQPALHSLGGGVYYAVPDGWAEHAKGHSVQLVPTDLPAGEVCMVLIGPLCQSNGKDARAYLTDLLDAELKDEATVVKTGEPTPHRSSQGLAGYSLVRVLKHSGNFETLRVYFVTQVGPSDVQTTVWVATSEEIINRYEPGVRQILAYVRYPNAAARMNAGGAAAILPAPTTLPSELHGLYAATGFLAAAGIGGSAGNSYYYFLPNHRLYQGLPEGGLEGFDFARAAKQSPDRCGTYTLQNRTLSITFANGDTVTRDVAPAPRGLRIRTFEFELVSPLKAGKLRGTYEATLPGPPAADGSETPTRSTYTFTFDGHFTSAQSASPKGPATASRHGTYAAQGNTLVLTFDDTGAEKLTAWVFSNDANNPTPEVLNLAGHSYVLNNSGQVPVRK